MARYRRRMVKEKIEMNRHELQHTVRCSVRYERMTANFSRRLENAAIFLQITLGLAVFSDFASMKVVGAAVSIISIWVFVYRPGSSTLKFRISYAGRQKMPNTFTTIRWHPTH